MPIVSSSKVKLARPARQLELLVKPKLAYTSTSTGSRVAPTIVEIVLLMGQAASDAQPAVAARVGSVKSTAPIDVQAPLIQHPAVGDGGVVPGVEV